MTAPARALLQEFERRAITVELEGDRIRLRPSVGVPPALIEAARRYKPEILHELRRQRLSDVPDECPCGQMATYYEPQPGGGAPLCEIHAPTRYEGLGVSLPKRDVVQYYLGAPCDTCGSDRRWQSDDGKQHCPACEAPPARYAVSRRGPHSHHTMA